MAYPIEEKIAVFTAFVSFFEKTLLGGMVQPRKTVEETVEETFYFTRMFFGEDPSKRYVAYVLDDPGGTKIYIRQELEGFVGGIDEMPLVHTFYPSRKGDLSIFPDSVDILKDKHVRYNYEEKYGIRSIKIEKEVYQRLRELFEDPPWIENSPEV